MPEEKIKMPVEISQAIAVLEKNSFEAYAVGGCVRDILRQETPNDWDLTTNAPPEKIEEIFVKEGFKTFYENKFGTVTVILNGPEPNLKEIEITPFRTESNYEDKRHPSEISWAKSLKDDLQRRDFTANAIALTKSQKVKPKNKAEKQIDEDFLLIDPFNGQEDIKNHLIKAVGNPAERFQEDALRMMRAIRLAVCLDRQPWQIEEKTWQAIVDNQDNFAFVSEERIKDELVKIIQSHNGARGIELLRRAGLLRFIIPELEQGFNNGQNKHHIYQVYPHNILSLNFACKKNFTLHSRLSALLHDVGKPQTKSGQGQNSTFYSHEIVGAKIAKNILQRLKFPKKDIEKISKLVRFHLFYYNTDEVGESSVRRLLKNVGQENIEELLQVRQADRIGSGVPKAEPYKLRHLKYLFEKVSQDPILPKMLAINGSDIMNILNIQPSPKIGQILSYLLSEVLNDPQKNKKEYLLGKTQELGKMPDNDLQKLAQKAKREVEQVETKRDGATKQKYWVT